MTLLHIALQYGDEASAQQFLERGADVSAVDWMGMTPLNVCSKQGHETAAQLLVDRRAALSAVEDMC